MVANHPGSSPAAMPPLQPHPAQPVVVASQIGAPPRPPPPPPPAAVGAFTMVRSVPRLAAVAVIGVVILLLLPSGSSYSSLPSPSAKIVGGGSAAVRLHGSLPRSPDATTVDGDSEQAAVQAAARRYLEQLHKAFTEDQQRDAKYNSSRSSDSSGEDSPIDDEEDAEEQAARLEQPESREHPIGSAVGPDGDDLDTPKNDGDDPRKVVVADNTTETTAGDSRGISNSTLMSTSGGGDGSSITGGGGDGGRSPTPDEVVAAVEAENIARRRRQQRIAAQAGAAAQAADFDDSANENANDASLNGTLDGSSGTGSHHVLGNLHNRTSASAAGGHPSVDSTSRSSVVGEGPWTEAEEDSPAYPDDPPYSYWDLFAPAQDSVLARFLLQPSTEAMLRYWAGIKSPAPTASGTEATTEAESPPPPLLQRGQALGQPWICADTLEAYVRAGVFCQALGSDSISRVSSDINTSVVSSSCPQGPPFAPPPGIAVPTCEWYAPQVVNVLSRRGIQQTTSNHVGYPTVIRSLVTVLQATQRAFASRAAAHLGELVFGAGSASAKHAAVPPAMTPYVAQEFVLPTSASAHRGAGLARVSIKTVHNLVAQLYVVSAPTGEGIGRAARLVDAVVHGAHALVEARRNTIVPITNTNTTNSGVGASVSLVEAWGRFRRAQGPVPVPSKAAWAARQHEVQVRLLHACLNPWFHFPGPRRRWPPAWNVSRGLWRGRVRAAPDFGRRYFNLVDVSSVRAALRRVAHDGGTVDAKSSVLWHWLDSAPHRFNVLRQWASGYTLRATPPWAAAQFFCYHCLASMAAAITDRVVAVTRSDDRSLAVVAERTGHVAGLLRPALRRELRVSRLSAMSGDWNNSALPSWLRLPSRVNVGNCLDEQNQQKSVLFFGSSHARNLYTMACAQYTGSHDAETCTAETFAQVPRTPHRRAPNASTAGSVEEMAMVFCMVPMDMNNLLSQCLRNILERLPPLNATTGSTRQEEDPTEKKGFSSHLANIALNFELSPPQRAYLRTLFTHVVVVPGIWESVYGDETAPERAENTALLLEVLEELFAPRRTVLYNMHAVHLPHGWDNFDMDRETRVFPAATRPSDTYARSYCTLRRRHYGDAQLCGASVYGRRRVREAWAARMAMGIPKGKVSHVDVVDFFPATRSSIGAHFVDKSGHHFNEVVLEAMTQRLLRDYVCPPRYALAVPDGAAVVSRGDVLDLPGLPSRSPVPGDGPPVAVELVPAGPDGGLPVLERRAGGALAVRGLLPLMRAPDAAVAEAVCRTIWDSAEGVAAGGAGAVAWASRHPNGSPDTFTNTSVDGRHGVPFSNHRSPFHVAPMCACLRQTRLRPALADLPPLPGEVLTSDAIRNASRSTTLPPTADTEPFRNISHLLVRPAGLTTSSCVVPRGFVDLPMCVDVKINRVQDRLCAVTFAEFLVDRQREVMARRKP